MKFLDRTWLSSLVFNQIRERRNFDEWFDDFKITFGVWHDLLSRKNIRPLIYFFIPKNPLFSVKQAFSRGRWDNQMPIDYVEKQIFYFKKIHDFLEKVLEDYAVIVDPFDKTGQFVSNLSELLESSYKNRVHRLNLQYDESTTPSMKCIMSSRVA